MENTAKKIWTIEEIKAQIEKSDKWVERAIKAIYNKQTIDEKATEDTRHNNSVGFSGAHAHYGSYLAKYIISGKRLDGKHLIKARKMALRYAGQLTKIANGEI